MAAAALALLCAGGWGAQGQPSAHKRKVAVYVAGSAPEGDRRLIASKLTAAISADRRYAAVERTAEFLKALQAEHDYQHSGEVDEEQIAAIGKKLGVNYVCAAVAGNVRGALHVEARLINVVTAEIAITVDELAVFSKEENADYDLYVLVNLAESIAAKLAAANEDASQMRQTGGALTAQTADIASGVPMGEAQTLCQNSRTGGYSDWRLPSVKEFGQLKGEGISFGGDSYWVTGGGRNSCMSAAGGGSVKECTTASARCIRNSD